MWLSHLLCIAADMLHVCHVQSDMSQSNTKSPMQYIHEHEPMKVHGLTVASYGCELSCLLWVLAACQGAWSALCACMRKSGV